MWTDAASRSIGAVCFTIIVLRQLGLASASLRSCPNFPEDSSVNAAARSAMKCVQPIEAARDSAGHVFLSSDLTTIPSWNTAKSTTNNELRAFPAASAATAKVLSIGSATCALAAVALSKSDNTPAATVQMRLDFERCTLGPSRASVLMNVGSQPDASVPLSMVPFWSQISKVDTTTPPPFVKAKLKLTFTQLELGNSTCDASLLASYPALDKKQCKMLCIAEVEKYASSINALTNSQLACRAYDFNQASGCNLYKGLRVTQISGAAGSSGTTCYNLTAVDTQFQQKTTPPPTDEAVTLANLKLPKSEISVVAGSANILTFESPDKCFVPFYWITLQDADRQTISVNVKKSEWTTFLELIPFNPQARILASSQDVLSNVFSQRAAYAAETPPVAPAVAPIAPTAPPCPAEEEAASMTMTWVLVTLAVIASVAGFLHGSHGLTTLTSSAALLGAKDSLLKAATAPAQSQPQTQKVGDQVEGLYKNGEWFKATIERINGDGTYTLKWADGDTQDKVKPAAKIRRTDTSVAPTETGPSTLGSDPLASNPSQAPLIPH